MARSSSHQSRFRFNSELGTRLHDSHKLIEARHVERATAAEGDGGDAVLDALRSVFTDTRLLEPVGVLLRLGQVEQARTKQPLRFDATPRRLDELGVRVEASQNRSETSPLGVAHQVHLVHDDDVGELKLVTKELCHSALVLRGDLPPAAPQLFRRVQLVEESCAVDHSDERVEREVPAAS